MSNDKQHIREKNLSIAWAKAFVEVMEHSEVSPLTITVDGLDTEEITEDRRIRTLLDTSLSETGHISCETVAGTIFPMSFWNPNREADLLFARYRRCRKRILQCPANHNGVYFDRLMAYGKDNGEAVNQLAYIIKTYTEKDNHRRSALQATVLDPRSDESDQQRRGFPCLQQIGFVPMSKKRLNVVAFYPMQHLYNKAYGNYLGLCRLGQFMAQEMGLTLAQLTCFVGIGQYSNTDKIKKTPLRGFQKDIEDIVDEYKASEAGNA